MTKKCENGEVSYKCEDAIGYIEFYHPKGNSLPGSLLSHLADSITTAAGDSDCNVIVLKSGGDKTFCAGASFDELLQIRNAVSGKAFFMGFANVINAMRRTPKMIICRVQGKTIGGGVGLAAASDFCFGVTSASVRLSELSLGIGPFVVGPAVERKIGRSAFTSLALDANNWMDAEWAFSKGLYNRLADSQETLDQLVFVLAKDLAAANPEAIRHLKQIAWEGTDHWDTTLEKRAEISGELILSEYSKKYIDQFRSV